MLVVTVEISCTLLTVMIIFLTLLTICVLSVLRAGVKYTDKYYKIADDVTNAFSEIFVLGPHSRAMVQATAV